MAMTVRHAAPQSTCVVQAMVGPLLMSFELVEKVAQLFDEEGVGLGQATKLLRVAVVMGQTVTGREMPMSG